MLDNLSFGEFITAKRQEIDMSLRKFANSIGKAPSYVCDIEKGKKNPVEKDFLKKIANVLRLNKEDTNTLFDLSANNRKELAPTDITEYIKATPMASVALRSAREAKISDKDWKEIINLIQQKAK